MKRFLILFAILSFLISCAGPQEGRNEINIALAGTRLEICEDAPLFRLVYANDTIVIASLLSSQNRIGMYRIGAPEDFHEFLNVGRGPMEVVNTAIISRSDTLHVLSYDSFGISGIIRIPVACAADMQSWKYTDYSDVKGLWVGVGFCMRFPDEYVMLGEKPGQENIMCVLSRKTSSVTPVHFWPDDGFDGPGTVKQVRYMLGSVIFCNGDKVLYVCDEGRYASILNLSGSSVLSETKIYDEYPQYKDSGDGFNPRRNPDSHIGVNSFATDSLIYVSPVECKLDKGKYIPDNYKGYPPYFTDRIEVYDWDGNYVRTYSLDVPFGNFYVSGDNRFLYTISENPETMFMEIYRYELN